MIDNTTSIGITMKDAIPATIGAGAATFPLWNFLSGANEAIIGIVGLVVLVLTVRIKWAELKIKKAELKKLQDDG